MLTSERLFQGKTHKLRAQSRCSRIGVNGDSMNRLAYIPYRLAFDLVSLFSRMLNAIFFGGSTPGKGMKQADDIVRSYTIAKAREDVTFDSPSDIKMIACIYLCG